MAEGWGGDPGHSGAKPMMGLKGGMASAYMQAPMESDNTGPARGIPTATTGEIMGWDKSVIGSGMSGGDHLNPAHAINGKPSDY